MGRTLGIVQPHEAISVAEQIYLIQWHAGREGVDISGFAGSDDLLLEENSSTTALMDSIASGEIDSIVFVDAIAEKLPACIRALCRKRGCKVLIVDRYKAGLGVA